MQAEQDSYEQYKRELEEELGVSQLKAPTRPMNAYMRFFLERSSEERAGRQVQVNALSRLISQEWKDLPAQKKDYYFQMHEIRRREWDALQVEYELLSNRRKVLSPYSRFIKKRYLQYSKEYKNLSSLEVTKLANEDWKALSDREKDRLREEFEAEREDQAMGIDRSDQVAEYLERLERYQEVIAEDKEKILRKYGLTAENRARLREESRNKKVEMKRFLKEEREKAAKEDKRRYREAVKQKAAEERERVRRIREEQRLQEKEALRAEREKAKAEAVAQKQLQAMLKQLEKHQKNEEEKIKEETVKAERSEEKPKPAKKKAVKAKKIKKAAKPALRASHPKSEEKKEQVHKFLAKLPNKAAGKTRSSKKK